MTDSILPIITPEQQAALRARFNPDGSLLRRHQLRMLDMLRRFDDYCSRHGITYWLSSGTCLGAIRHGGFIPWDDDVDVEMHRRDVIRLRRAVAAEPIPGLLLQTPANDPLYPQPFAKLRDPDSIIQELDPLSASYRFRGIYIDIFAIAPSNSLRLAKLGACVQNVFVNRPLRLSASVSRLLVPAGKFIAHRLLFPLLSALASVGASRRLRHLPGTAFHAPRPAKAVEATVRVPFEGFSFPVPADYDAYLSSIFGDYAKLPPTSEITPHITDLVFLDSADGKPDPNSL